MGGTAKDTMDSGGFLPGAEALEGGRSGPLSLSVGQVAFFIAYVWTLVMYLYATALARRRLSKPASRPHVSDGALAAADPETGGRDGGGGGGGGSAKANGSSGHHGGAGESVPLLPMGNGAGGRDGSGAKCPSPNGSSGDLKPSAPRSPSSSGTALAAAGQAAAAAGGGSGSSGAQGSMLAEMADSGLVQCLLLRRQALLDARPTLQAAVEFGTLMAWFFLCDRTDLLPAAAKRYDRDLFLFIFLALAAVALGTSLQPVRAPLLLNRPQTEEWKGWMQVLFLLYHYFEAREAYNAIRVFIAGYVWLTGYGNFSYYARTGDFGIGRFCQTVWRLNFLVFFCCVVLRNEYMLYYICPMHTIFTVLVYGALAVAPRLNKSQGWLWAKIAACLALVLATWDAKPVFYALWRPLDAVVGYTNPRKPDADRLHEWHFRSSLDRFVWIYGMACALLHPALTRLLAALEELPPRRRALTRAGVAAATCAALALYYKTVFSRPKLEYNALHPYTSWIPLTCWVVLRNLSPGLRTWSARLFGWLGCITLETYLSQFHVWLRSGVPNGQPKFLLALVPGYPLLNFVACTALYVYISHRLFVLTNALKDAALPHDDNRRLARNLALLAALLSGAAALGWAAHAAGSALFASGAAAAAAASTVA